MSKHKIHRFASTQLNAGIQHSNEYVCMTTPCQEVDTIPQFIKWLEDGYDESYDIWYGRFPLHGLVSLQATPKSVKAKLCVDQRLDSNGNWVGVILNKER